MVIRGSVSTMSLQRQAGGAPVDRGQGGGPLRARWMPADFHLVDLLCIAYTVSVAALIILFRDRVGLWRILVVSHIGLTVLAVALPEAAARHPRRRLLDLVRVYYPALIFVFGYLEMEFIQTMLTGGWTASAWLIHLDWTVFRTHATVAVERFYGSALDELFAFFYLSYYFVPLIVSVALLRRGRREELLTVAAAVALTYFANFALFLLIPALGPRSAPEMAGLHHAHYHGPLFARLCRLAEGDSGPVAGAVFPSSHVSATLAWGLATFTLDRRLAWIAIGFAAAIMPSTVYLGYHYAIDSMAGALLPLATVPLAFAMARRRSELVSTTLEGA